MSRVQPGLVLFIYSQKLYATTSVSVLKLKPNVYRFNLAHHMVLHKGHYINITGVRVFFQDLTKHAKE